MAYSCGQVGLRDTLFAVGPNHTHETRYVLPAITGNNFVG